MAQTLELPTRRGSELSKEDQQILHSLEDGELPIEQVVALSDVEPGRALSSITKLIAVGYLRLVIVEYLWGVEFVLQPRGMVTSIQPGKED